MSGRPRKKRAGGMRGATLKEVRINYWSSRQKPCNANVSLRILGAAQPTELNPLRDAAYRSKQQPISASTKPTLRVRYRFRDPAGVSLTAMKLPDPALRRVKSYCPQGPSLRICWKGFCHCGTCSARCAQSPWGVETVSKLTGEQVVIREHTHHSSQALSICTANLGKSL